MAVALAALGSYGMSRMAENAQARMREKYEQNNEVFKTVMEAAKKYADEGRGNLFENEAGQGLLKNVIKDKDQADKITSGFGAYAISKAADAKARMTRAVNDAMQPGATGEQGKADVSAMNTAFTGLPGVPQQTSSLASASQAASTQALQGAQTTLATEQAGLAGATKRRIDTLTPEEVKKMASDVAVNTSTVGLQGAQAGQITALTPALVEAKQAEAAHNRALVTYMPEHIDIARKDSETRMASVRNQYELGQEQNAIARQQAATAEDKVKVERESLAATVEYQQKHMENLRILQAGQTQDHMRQLYTNANPIALRNVAQYSVGLLDKLPAGSELPPGMSQAMVQERLRLNNQLEKNGSAYSALNKRLTDKDFKSLGDAEKHQQIDMELSKLNTNLMQTVTESTVLNGTPYDVLAGKDKAEFLRDNIVLYDVNKGIFTTARQAERDYGSLQVGTGAGLISKNKPAILGTTGLDLGALQGTKGAQTSASSPEQRIVDRAVGKVPLAPPTAKSTPEEAAAWRAQTEGKTTGIVPGASAYENKGQSSVSDRRIDLMFDRHNNIATAEFKLLPTERAVFKELVNGGMSPGKAANHIITHRPQ